MSLGVKKSGRSQGGCLGPSWRPPQTANPIPCIHPAGIARSSRCSSAVGSPEASPSATQPSSRCSNAHEPASL